MARVADRRHWRPPTTLRTAVRRALDRAGGQHLDEVGIARALRDELHAAGFQITSSTRPRNTTLADDLDIGRPMTPAEARSFGIRLVETGP